MDFWSPDLTINQREIIFYLGIVIFYELLSFSMSRIKSSVLRERIDDSE